MCCSALEPSLSLSPYQCKRHPLFQSATGSPSNIFCDEHRLPLPLCCTAISSRHGRTTDREQKPFFSWHIPATTVNSTIFRVKSFHCAVADVGGTAISFNLLTSICQFGNFLADKWRRACFVKWSLLMNRRSHIGQANFFSPVCVLRWRDSSSDRANLLSQPFQLQLNGFSPKRKKKDKEKNPMNTN